jgi:MFS family permease
VAGLMGAALNGGILMLSQIARTWHITAESWRWIFQLAAAPALLGLLVLLALPESPLWLATRDKRRPSPALRSSPPAGEETLEERAREPAKAGVLRRLFRPPLLRLTLIGILLGSIPMVGAWAASKWMIPWADKIGGDTQAGYKAVTQGWWALGAVLGSFFGAQIAARLGRRRAYALISAGATSLTLLMFLGTAPLQASFLPVVFAQGFVATLFFGWLPLYLPELFPTQVRAAGSGIAYNVGRFATAIGVMIAGALFSAMGGSYPRVGAVCGLIYLLGLIAIWWAPDTSTRKLDE